MPQVRLRTSGSKATLDILGAASASADYREVHIIRDYYRGWDSTLWVRQFAWRPGIVATSPERRDRRDGIVEVHRCD
jgi:hypothetical protein